jgi:hypothetical protein
VLPLLPVRDVSGLIGVLAGPASLVIEDVTDAVAGIRVQARAGAVTATSAPT